MNARISKHYPDATPIKVDPDIENEIADWLHELSPSEWDMTFDHDTAEMFIFLPTMRLATLAKLRWGGAA